MESFAWPDFREIDLGSFARRQSYELFLNYDNPTATRTVDLDVTALMAYIKDRSLRFTAAFGFLLARAVNHVPEFRCRLQDGIPVEYEHVIPSFAVLKNDQQLAYAKGVYSDSFSSDYAANRALIERVRQGYVQDVGTGSHGLFWLTINPWNRFTSLQFPLTAAIADIPIFGVGKISGETGRMIAPFAVRIHHSFVDGYHVAHFLHVIEKHLADPSLLEHPFVSDFSL
jgi:chloramphenicol O-acetyltransferase type A